MAHNTMHVDLATHPAEEDAAAEPVSISRMDQPHRGLRVEAPSPTTITGHVLVLAYHTG
jgi:hypothetical protein